MSASYGYTGAQLVEGADRGVSQASAPVLFGDEGEVAVELGHGGCHVREDQPPRVVRTVHSCGDEPGVARAVRPSRVLREASTRPGRAKTPHSRGISLVSTRERSLTTTGGCSCPILRRRQ